MSAAITASPTASPTDTTAPNCRSCDDSDSLQMLDEGGNLNSILLFGTLLGGALIANSYVATWTYESHLSETDQIVSGMTGFLGAVFLSAPVVIRAISAILRGERDLGELATIAIFACFAINDYREAGIVAFLLMLAELLEDRTAQGAKAAVERLIQLTPTEAHFLDANGNEVDKSVSELKVGDMIRVRPGENIPVDGVIKTGESTINQASVTGESLPIDASEGNPVFAGTVNLTGLLDVEVSKVGSDTTLGKVRTMILEAENTKLPIARLIDQYIVWYTPTMVMIAVMIFYFTKDIENAITALVIGCPCALVLATPTAMVAGLTCAARFGILVKNVSHLESAAEINAVVFDKTGTLTTGQLTVQRLSPIEGTSAETFVRFAASADRNSNHPAARALVNLSKQAGVETVPVKDFKEIGGQGVQATVDQHTIRVGRKTWLASLGIGFEGVAEENHDAAEGYSYLYVACDDLCIGWAAMVDTPRPESKIATEELQQLGMQRLTMLTGDRWGAARRVASQLGCTDVVAECLPEQKLEVVESMKNKGLRVAVIGDGVNDAPALAAGDLGVAMGAAGNDVAIHSASIALMSDDISKLPFLIKLSRKVRVAVLTNLGLGLVIMIAGLILSGMGYLNPIIAAIFHNVGSIIVIFNSARLVRFGEELVPTHSTV